MAEERVPNAGLNKRTLPLVANPPKLLSRLHRNGHEVLWFGVGLGARFNDPREEYGVCYLGCEPACALVETLLRDRDDVVEFDAIETRQLASVPVKRELRLVALYGEHLSRLRANTTAVHGRYRVSQAWSRTLHDHPDTPDGIAYRPAHDDSLTAVAMFERASDALLPAQSRPLLDEIALLDALAARYGFVVV